MHKRKVIIDYHKRTIRIIREESHRGIRGRMGQDEGVPYEQPIFVSDDERSDKLYTPSEWVWSWIERRFRPVLPKRENSPAMSVHPNV